MYYACGATIHTHTVLENNHLRCAYNNGATWPKNANRARGVRLAHPSSSLRGRQRALPRAPITVSRITSTRFSGALRNDLYPHQHGRLPPLLLLRLHHHLRLDWPRDANVSRVCISDADNAQSSIQFHRQSPAICGIRTAQFNSTS